MRFLICLCFLTWCAAATGCSGNNVPEAGSHPLGDLSALDASQTKLVQDAHSDTVSQVSERAEENTVNKDDGDSVPNKKAHADDDPDKRKAETRPDKTIIHHQPMPEVCNRYRSSRWIQIDGDPTAEVRYDLETLGVVTMTDDAARHSECLDVAIRDGAQVLTHTDSLLRVFYPTRFEAYIDAASERINIDAVEGRWSETQHRIIPGVSGRKVNIAASQAAFVEAVSSDSDRFSIVVDEKTALSADLSSIGPFEPTVLLGQYQTKFARKKNRTINVKLAASSLDGVFLMPGAEVSYNEWVGERSEARGFKEAPVIEQGEMVEGLGGGACQVSSTVHAAALLAGLGIEERYNHSLPSSYIPVGMDAVVSYPMLDLRIKNTHTRPVVLRVHTEDNALIARFYSDKPKTDRVLFRREVSSEIPYQEIITTDPLLPPGTIRITKRGKVGYKVQRGRIYWENDVERYEKLLMDTYRPQTQHVSIAMDVIYPPPEEPLVPTNAPAVPSDAI